MSECDISSPYKEKVKISTNPITFYLISIIISSFVLMFYQTNMVSFINFLLKLRENKEIINTNEIELPKQILEETGLFNKILNKILYGILFITSKLEWRSFSLLLNEKKKHEVNIRGFTGIQSIFLTSGLFYTIVMMISTSTLTYYSLTFSEDKNIKEYFYEILYNLIGIPLIGLLLFVALSFLLTKIKNTKISIYPILTLLIILLFGLSFIYKPITDLLIIFVPLCIIIIAKNITNPNWNLLDLLPSVLIFVFIIGGIRTGNYINDKIFGYNTDVKDILKKELKESNEEKGEAQVKTLLENKNITVVSLIISLIFLLFIFILNFKQPIMNNFVYTYIVIPLILILTYSISFTNLFKDTGNNKCHTFKNKFNDNINDYCKTLKNCDVPI